MKRVFIDTMGCQMNKSDTERMLGMLSYLGYDETKEPKEADLLIINTCSIRQLSEDKAFSEIGTWGQWKKHGKDIKKMGVNIDKNEYYEIICSNSAHPEDTYKKYKN